MLYIALVLSVIYLNVPIIAGILLGVALVMIDARIGVNIAKNHTRERVDVRTISQPRVRQDILGHLGGRCQDPGMLITRRPEDVQNQPRSYYASWISEAYDCINEHRSIRILVVILVGPSISLLMVNSILRSTYLQIDYIFDTYLGGRK